MKRDFEYSKIFYYFYMLIILSSIFALGFVFWFLYENFYQVVAQSEKIVVPEEEIAIGDIDDAVFDQIKKELKNKTKQRNWMAK